MSDYPEILVSKLITPDGTVLHSRGRHNYITHVDNDTNCVYMLDGGTDYVRSSAWGDEEYLTLTTEDPHEVVREHFDWGTRGADGDQPLTHILLKDLATDHIDAILDTQGHLEEKVKNLLREEIKFRGEYDV